MPFKKGDICDSLTLLVFKRCLSCYGDYHSNLLFKSKRGKDRECVFFKAAFLSLSVSV